MDGLINTTLIKSAKFDFASVNLDGNTLFIGANGAGKTTLLRAILFFYTGSGEGLGINRGKNKISFADYYFPYENSYILYTYKKGEKYVLVVAYRDGNIKYYFALFDKQPNIEEIFITDEKKPIELAYLKPRLKEVSNISNIIQNGAKYREILYSKHTKEREFTLFEAREYEPFTRTLSNIFVNSKIDSNAIKKVIVSSLNLETSINILQIQRFLKEFQTLYEDILLFEKSQKDINRVVDLLKGYEQTKIYMDDEFKTLFSSKVFLVDEVESLAKEFERATNEQERGKALFQKEEGAFYRKKEGFIAKKATNNDFLKKCDEKRGYYEKENIEIKKGEYERKGELESKLKREISNREFLTEAHQQLHEAHQNQIEKIHNSFTTQKNSLERQKLTLEGEQKEKISKIQMSQNDAIGEIKERYSQKRVDIQVSLGELGGQKKDLEFEKRGEEKGQFIFEHQEDLENLTLDEQQKTQKVHQLRGQLGQLDTKLTHEEQLYHLNFEKETKKFEGELENIAKQIEQIQKILTPVKGSLIDTIYEKSSHSGHYLHFLREDILHSTLDFDFKDFSNHLFELDFKDFEPKNSNLTRQIEQLKTKQSQKQKEQTKALGQLEGEFRNHQNRIYREKRELNDAIMELEKNLKFLEVKRVKLAGDKEKANEIFKRSRGEKLERLSQSIEALGEKIGRVHGENSNLSTLESNEIKEKKSEFTKKSKGIESFYFEPLKRVEEGFVELEKNKKQALETQNENYNNLLKEKNVDIKKLQLIEGEIATLQSQLKQIDGYTRMIFEYDKDKKEYFDHEYEYKKSQKLVREELKRLEGDFEQRKIEFDAILKQHSSKITQLQKQIDGKKYDLKMIMNFEESPVFERYKSLGFVYESNGSIKEDTLSLVSALGGLKEQYDEGYKKIQNQISKLAPLFGNSLGIKKQLDDVDTAYDLKQYFEQKSIEHSKGLLGENVDNIIKSIVGSYDKLLESQGKIKSLIGKITKLFSTIEIRVIDSLELRYQESNHKIIEIISKIKSENIESGFGLSTNLFASSNDTSGIVKLLIDLIDTIEEENTNTINLEESFILEFKVVENGNDSKWLSSLDMIGSNGTDVLVKSMVYIAMLHIFKKQSTKKELMIQVVLDEVGILSQKYLKELIEFANKFGILFVNGAPDEKLIGTYKRVSLVSNINSKPFVRELIIK